MGKKTKPKPPVAVVSFVVEGDGFGIEVESDLTEETLAALLRGAADQIEGVDDRAAGAWGRS
jgi:hypothetical protein